VGNINVNYVVNLPPRFLSIVRDIGRLADKKDLSVYLVGGVVRDLILNREIKDLDFVVEGDAIKLAQSIALEKKFKVTVYHQFGTATVFWKNQDFRVWRSASLQPPVLAQRTDQYASLRSSAAPRISSKRESPENDLEIDFVSARKEIYEYSGALPKVEMAGLPDDLFRRDFTINTLCLSINKESWGKLVDLYGGLDDLKSKLICVLHEKSFLDDPTRILRAVRFAQRLNFQIESRTLGWIKQAVQQNTLKNVKLPRLFQELKKNFSEKKSKNQIQALQKMKVLSAIHQSLKVDVAKLDAIDAFFKKNAGEKWLFVFMSLVSNFKSKELDGFLKIIQLNKMDQKSVSQSLEVNRVLSALNKHLINRSEIYMILNSFQLETVRYFYVCARTVRQKKRIRCYLDRDRFKQTSINGDDLRRIGFSDGKEMKKVLMIILSQKINGLIKSTSDELQSARQYLQGLKK